jgi:EAL domain-containing protein (putative c-di-GMP-specific phosphodiesterase class I)
VARHPEDQGAVLLQRADVALYTAKRDRTSLESYDPANDHISARRLELTRHLRDAVIDRQLEVFYQAKMDPRTGDIVGAEALLRWTHPLYGRVSPDEFIPLAEHSGVIHPLTCFVLDTALRDCVRWRERGHPAGVAVNLSTRSLTDQKLPHQVREALQRSGLPPEALTLEITETSMMSNLTRSLEVLAALRELGVRMSIDDFGTGQSSLAYLKQLPVHEVKIDKSFVLGLADGPDDGYAAIVRAAIDLGHALGLRVVAEGVENAATQRRLARWGCDLVQGFHITRPVAADAFVAWLDRHEPRALTEPAAADADAGPRPATRR